MGRVGAVSALVLCLGLWATAAVAADVPPGPRLAFVEFGEEPLRLELRTHGVIGEQTRRVAGGSASFNGPVPEFLQPLSWSADGSTLAFTGFKPGTGRHSQASIYVAAADGSGLRRLKEGNGTGPVLSPDGSLVAFTRTRRKVDRRSGELSYQSSSTWLADLKTGKARPLTPWRNGLEIEPTSFSPDGATLALVQRRGETATSEVVLMSLANGVSTVLAKSASDAVFSPDGTRLAYLSIISRGTAKNGRKGESGTASLETTSDLSVMNADGSDPVQLTHTRKELELFPSWDPSGRRLAFTRLTGGKGIFPGIGDSIVQINADGSCQSRLMHDPGIAYYGAAWQPGQGREAGSIVC